VSDGFKEFVAQNLSLPGLTRQPIVFERLFRKERDARVKPAHDGAILMARADASTAATA
jgi:hypothetical protein